MTHCTWQQQDNGCEYWETSCNGAFWLDVGKPSDNRMKFCCYCGLPIKEKEFMYPDREEE